MDLVNRKNLVELFKDFLWDTELCDDFDFCIDHHEKCIKLIFTIFSNMLFNNFTKIVNDAIETHKSQRIKYTKDKYIKFT